MNLVTQLEDDGCLRACLAMIAGVEYFAVPESVKWGLTNAENWLRSQGFIVTPLVTNYTPRAGRIYLVSAPSLNMMSQLHEMVMDCTTEPNQLLDPRDGCENKIPYTLSTMYRRNQYRIEYEVSRAP
jgi:hypothetical protein